MATGTPTFKVILCGEYGAGKSAVFRRFIDNSFSPETGQRSTVGLDYFSKSFKVRGQDKMHEIKMEVWDTAGIERFATLSASYFHGASAAILCYSSIDRESFNMLSQHLLEIIMHSKTAKVFLCSTKSDLKSHDSISDGDVAAFQEQCDTALSECFYTSAKTGDGCGEMFQTIANTLISDIEQRFAPSLDYQKGFMVQPTKKNSSCCSGSEG